MPLTVNGFGFGFRFTSRFEESARSVGSVRHLLLLQIAEGNARVPQERVTSNYTGNSNSNTTYWQLATSNISNSCSLLVHSTQSQIHESLPPTGGYIDA
ncbi:uncharacterized protein Dana_GF26601 [Drosophila ananassae]|uniref:Uncharacterized protein n=1 Tax=Drosophila ananassae TaxID=7217 RepID=A0A0P9A2U8_DROAN|nr:uncharacterized protein Dana_GF26601 [Drosophila ananassae]